MNIFIERTTKDSDLAKICQCIEKESPGAKIYLLPNGVRPWHEIFNLELYRQARGVVIRKPTLPQEHR